jgi:hypothetical protein
MISRPRDLRIFGCGVSSRRTLDDEYRAFIERVAAHITTALINVRAFEQERRRAEALSSTNSTAIRRSRSLARACKPWAIYPFKLSRGSLCCAGAVKCVDARKGREQNSKRAYGRHSSSIGW